MPLRHYFSLVKFSHTVFALPFALVGFMMGLKAAQFRFEWISALLVLICMVSARTAAMAFNRWADREIDARNERTKNREIPAGIISPKNSLIMVIANSLVFVASAWFINRLCFFLSPVALAVILGYSYTKRFTPFSHLVLGLGLSFAPIGAYLAVTGRFDWPPVLISLAVMFWVSGFDIIYALQDESFDRKMKLYSFPSWLGIKNALLFSRIMHFISSVLIITVYAFNPSGIIYPLAWVVFTALLIYQHSLVKPDDISRVNMAFFTTNGLASVVFGLLVMIDFIRQWQ
jgi:4-hydroxybenzoate polyprenyltransferase